MRPSLYALAIILMPITVLAQNLPASPGSSGAAGSAAQPNATQPRGYTPIDATSPSLNNCQIIWHRSNPSAAQPGGLQGIAVAGNTGGQMPFSASGNCQGLRINVE